MKVVFHEGNMSTIFSTEYMEHSAYAKLIKTEDSWYLSRLFVPEDIRRQGVGTTLVKYIVEWADCNDYTIYLDLSLYCGIGYEALKCFYIKCGFICSDTLCYLGDKDKVIDLATSKI